MKKLLITLLVIGTLAGCKGTLTKQGDLSFEFDADGATKYTMNYGGLYATAKINQQLATTQKDKDLENYRIEGYGVLIDRYVNGSVDKLIAVFKNFTALISTTPAAPLTTAPAASTQPNLQTTNPQPTVGQ